MKSAEVYSKLSLLSGESEESDKMSLSTELLGVDIRGKCTLSSPGDERGSGVTRGGVTGGEIISWKGGHS